MTRAKKRIAIVGGGASGTGLLWCLTSQETPANQTEITLFHDESEIGGHSRTIPVWFDRVGKGHVENPPQGTTTYPVDIGVQFVCSTLYPNLYRQLELPEFKHVKLKRHAELRMSTAFGPDRCWGNFGPYQSGPRFEKLIASTREEVERFEKDLQRAPFLKLDGKPALKFTVGEYLEKAGYSREGDFFRYLLIPYLCIINGYGTVDLLQTTLEDLYPIFAKLPLLQKVGPYGSFSKTGLGWDRFEFGATQWVQAMCDYGVARGARVRTASPVRRVRKQGSEWLVDFSEEAVGGRDLGPKNANAKIHSQAFDEVILTTDMTINRALMGHDENPHWDKHKKYLAAEGFGLLPGICYIHQDENVLAKSLRDQDEDGQFTGEFAWGASDEGSALYGLPYDLGASFQTYMMQNILDTPYPCYVSMYAEDRKSVVPDPAKTIHVRSWRHGRWVASFFRNAKKELHQIQGLGGIWFAGNNTTVDSEEGALLSAMIVASKIAGYRYPFSRVSGAHFFYAWFRELMFPSRGRGEWWGSVIRG